MDPVAKFGANVRALRLRAGLTQMEAADRADLALAHWSRIEHAKREAGIRTITRVARGLGVQPSELLDGIPPANDKTPRRRPPGEG